MERPPFPPFNETTAIEKVRLAEDGWNSRNPAKLALAYSVDSEWRNRAEFIHGRDQIEAFLTRKWTRELDYRLIKALWAFGGRRLKPFRLPLRYSDPHRLAPEIEQDLGLTFHLDAESLVKVVDIINLQMPLYPAPEHFFNDRCSR